MKSLLGILFFYGSLVHAVDVEPDFAQSSPSLQWYSIENKSVKLIYPSYLQSESVYIANLVEHYSHVVGQTYGIKSPKLFPLIVRPEMAQPNGYVTLMPRRSEWFASSMFFPSVGSTEWYQTLSIHEYRHVNQFDHFNRQATRVLYYLAGDLGVQLAAGITLPSWYLEGDAVWAETKYTDGGRGRSPRFMSRLKALVLSGDIPTYDQFLNGTYRTSVPNQYVYGYALISYATQKFGETVWSDITSDISEFPIPLRFYWSFKNVTGQSFEDFYHEAMNDLKKKWAVDATPPVPQKLPDYRENAAPFKVGDSLYYIKQTLNTHPTLFKEVKGQVEKIAELSYNMEFMGFDIGKTKAVYTRFSPHVRYQHKGSSDLMLIDLASGEKTKLTAGARVYNPRLNRSETKVVVTDFTINQTWNISEYDLQGKLLQSFALPESKVAEAVYLDDTNLIVLLENKVGEKSIATVNLQSKAITKVILPPSRNLLHSLFVDSKNNLFFEAQYKGYNQIFKFDGQGFAQCTQSKIGAYTPSSDGENLFFSHQDVAGSLIAQSPITECVSVEALKLTNFNYLGDTPSDNYNKFVPQRFPQQGELFTANAAQYQPSEYGDFDRELFVPHTWGINIGRGGGLGVRTDNYLRTLSLGANLGVSPEEGKSLVELNFDIKKYYPIFRLQLESRDRKVTDFATNDILEWEEKSAGVGMLIPYLKSRGLYNFQALGQFSGSYMNVANYKFNAGDVAGSNYFYNTQSSALLTWNKNLKARSILAPWLLSYKIRYDDVLQPSDKTLSSYRVLQQGVAQTPAFFANDGFQFKYDEQRQDQRSLGAYKFLPEGTAISYVFSRGYSYKDVSFFQKSSGEYVFPVAYPDMGGKWVYLKRIYSKTFFDSTFVNDPQLTATLNSYGVEVYLDTKLLRFLPMTFGGRVLQRLDNSQVKAEAFVASAIGF